MDIYIYIHNILYIYIYLFLFLKGGRGERRKFWIRFHETNKKLSSKEMSVHAMCFSWRSLTEVSRVYRL